MQELPGPADARDQAIGCGRHEDPYFCAGRAEIHDLDRWWNPGWFEHVPQGMTAVTSSHISSNHPSPILTQESLDVGQRR